MLAWTLIVIGYLAFNFLLALFLSNTSEDHHEHH